MIATSGYHSSSCTAKLCDSAARPWRGALLPRPHLGAVLAFGLISLTTGCKSDSSSQNMSQGLSQGDIQSQSQTSLAVPSPIPVPLPSPVQSSISPQSPSPVQSPSSIQSLIQGSSPSLSQSPSSSDSARPNAPNGLGLAVRADRNAAQPVFLFELTSAPNLPTVTEAQVPPTVPAPLPLLGVAAAFGYRYKLRKSIKNSGNSSGEFK
jgi:hypothetical protein